jgi:hypothetical protein
MGSWGPLSQPSTAMMLWPDMLSMLGHTDNSMHVPWAAAQGVPSLQLAAHSHRASLFAGV